VRLDGSGKWWKEDNKFIVFKQATYWGKRQSYDGHRFQGATGYPYARDSGKAKHPHHITSSGPDIGPTPVCICGNTVGGHGQVPKHICEKKCDMKTVAAVYGTNLEKGKWSPQAGNDKWGRKGEGNTFDGKFDHGRFDNDCILPCPKCWSVNKAGNWGGGPVGPWCGGKMCEGFPYAVCREWKTVGGENPGHMIGRKGAKKCAQGFNCGFNAQQAHWNKFQEGTQCGGLADARHGLATKVNTAGVKKYMNIVYEIKGYVKDITSGGSTSRLVTACAGDMVSASCKDGEHVAIIRAFYGRHKSASTTQLCGTSKAVCDGGKENDVTLMIQKSCGTTSRECLIQACRASLGLVTKGYLTSRCAKLRKGLYLQVKYACKKAKVTATATNEKKSQGKPYDLSSLTLMHGRSSQKLCNGKSKTIQCEKQEYCKFFLDANEHRCVIRPFCMAYKNGAKGGKRVENKCFKKSKLMNAQILIQCIRADTNAEICDRAADGKADSFVKLRNVKGAAFIIQHVTTRRFTHLILFRPPTSFGGSRTRLENVWYFEVQCWQGGKADTTKDALTDNSKWKTVFTNTAKSTLEMKKHDTSPGMKTFKLSPCSSTTWRITKMTSPFTVNTLDIFEASFKNVETPGTDGHLPRLGNVHMSVQNKNTDVPLVTTDFVGSLDRSVCSSIMQEIHGTLGMTKCRLAEDGDVNSPVVFDDQRNGNKTLAPPGITLFEAKAMKYKSVWVYLHPTHHQGTNGEHQRLNSFDIECQINKRGEKEKWKKVLDQDSKFGKGAFASVNHSPKPLPCIDCWTQIEFESTCESSAWRMSKLNGDKHVGHLKMYEMKFSKQSKSEVSSEGIHNVIKRDLPEAKADRVQGWCIRYTALPYDNGKCWKAVNSKANSGEHTLAKFKNPLEDVPCKSQFAIEMTDAWTASKKMSRGRHGGSNPPIFSLRTSQRLLGEKRTECFNQGWVRPMWIYCHEDAKRWCSKNDKNRDMYFAMNQNTYCKKDYCWGKGNNGAKVGRAAGCMPGGTSVKQSILSYTRGEKDFYLTLRNTAPGLGMWFRVKGTYKIAFWWKPPNPNMECSVSPGHLQYSSST